MAKCPACEHEVRTPFFLDLDGWRHLRCAQCKARLEMKPPRSFLLGPLLAPLFVLARQGRIFEIFAFVFAIATIFLILLESSYPKLRLRTRPLARPDVSLKIDCHSK
jgi:hypothetical protein